MPVDVAPAGEPIETTSRSPAAATPESADLAQQALGCRETLTISPLLSEAQRDTAYVQFADAAASLLPPDALATNRAMTIAHLPVSSSAVNPNLRG